jgi:hypothetical protein
VKERVVKKFNLRQVQGDQLLMLPLVGKYNEVNVMMEKVDLRAIMGAVILNKEDEAGVKAHQGRKLSMCEKSDTRDMIGNINLNSEYKRLKPCGTILVIQEISQSYQVNSGSRDRDSLGGMWRGAQGQAHPGAVAGANTLHASPISTHRQ